MLGNAPVAATIAVRDIDRAKTFYTDVLGLGVAMEPAPGVLFLGAGEGSMVQLYERPGHEPSAATIATFKVDDIDTTVAALVDAGVTFESYDEPGFRTGPDHILEGGRLAWLTDPDGNIIGLAEM